MTTIINYAGTITDRAVLNFATRARFDDCLAGRTASQRLTFARGLGNVIALCVERGLGCTAGVPFHVLTRYARAREQGWTAAEAMRLAREYQARCGQECAA